MSDKSAASLELRWVDWSICEELQYRTRDETGQWTEWVRVPGVSAKEVYPSMSDEPVTGRGARGDL